MSQFGFLNKFELFSTEAPNCTVLCPDRDQKEQFLSTLENQE
tara:strand:- start:1832 stop:1957 length:126 start_codon:yes stop_codon:yes gene_type:complete